MLCLISSIVRGDCVQNCRNIIQKSEAAIAARDQEIADQSKTITDLTSLNAATTNDLDSANAALAKWYHNPVTLLLLGAIAGGAGVVILEHK